MDEVLLALIGVLGTAITTTGTIIVAVISTKTRRDQKAIRQETEHDARENKIEILEAIDVLQKGLDNNSKVTVANARAMISQIYDDNKATKRITEKTWQNVMELHDAYKSVKINGHTPNSWCDSIVEEMHSWEKY